MAAGVTLEQVQWSTAEPAIRRIRDQVFVRELGVPAELEWDGRDADCVHLLAYSPGREPIATARIQADGRIARMAVLKPWRGRGIGQQLLQRLIEVARARGLTHCWLSAQTQAIGFYRAHGFLVDGEEFMAAGIPHRKMIFTLDGGG
jgi:predicted GNAT family N-acyltransferase